VKIDGLQNERQLSGIKTVGGFALLETLVGAGVLLFLIVSMCGAFSFGFRVVKVSQEDLRANQILAEKLETLRMYDWSKITNGYCSTNFTVTTGGSGTNGASVTYSGTLSISNAPIQESYSNTLKQVVVGVTWTSSNVSRSRSMSTLISQYGIQTYKP
jgi:Tfp pilus assembly protein PilV